MVMHATSHDIEIDLTPLQETIKSPDSWGGRIQHHISDYILSGRIIQNWQESIMIAGMATAVLGIAFTFFSGMTLLCGCYLLLLGVSVTGLYCARKSADMHHLQQTVNSLHATQGQFERLSTSLQNENHRLESSNHQLTETIESLQDTHADLEATNRNLQQSYEALQSTHAQFTRTHEELQTTTLNLQQSHEALQETLEQFRHTHTDLETTNSNLEENNQLLRQQITDLTLRVTQLSESGQRIYNEMILFQEENHHLAGNVRGFDNSLDVLDREITSSRSLCEQIERHLALQQRELGEQLGDLRQLITDLRTNESTNEKLSQLITLNEQIGRCRDDLSQVQIQYAAERANFEAIRDNMVRQQQELDATNRNLRSNIDHLNRELDATNRDLRSNVDHLRREFDAISRDLRSNADNFLGEGEAIREQRQRIQNLLDQFLALEPGPLDRPMPILPQGVPV